MIYMSQDDLPVQILAGSRAVIDEDGKESVHPIFAEVFSATVFLYFVDENSVRVDIGEIDYEGVRAMRAMLLENRLEHEKMYSNLNLKDGKN